MSIYSKMTAIADRLRAIDYCTDKLSLDAMATKLDTILTGLVNSWIAVNEKGGAVNGNAETGEGFEISKLADAIYSIPSTGGTKQEKSGTFTTGSDGTATVDCGFTPDYVIISNPRTPYSGHNRTATAHFAYDPDGLGTFALLVPAMSDDIYCNSFDLYPTVNGFYCLAENVGYDFMYSNATNAEFNYYAVKYE